MNTRNVPERDRQYLELWEQYGSPTVIANVLGISVRRSLTMRRDIERRYDIKLTCTNVGKVAASVILEGKPSQQFNNLQTLELEIRRRVQQEFEDKIRQMADRMRSAERKALDAQRESDREHDLRRAVFGLSDSQLDPPSWLVPKKVGDKTTTVPVLLFSDSQVGEVIKPREMDGINRYDMNVFAERYKRMIDKTIAIARDHMGGQHEYPGIVYARLGDMVSGEIHDELAQTNDLHSIPAVKWLVEHELAGLKLLAKVFGRVYVVSTPGNHGRTTRKPHAKKFAETNYDTLSAWWLESALKDDKRFTWQTPESGDALVPIAGHQFLFTHGDRIGSRGGEGFIGPAATIARGAKRTMDYYAKLGVMVDVLCVGHFHTRLELERCFVNGCVPGVSEYAKSGRMTPAEPSQWLLFVHHEHGVTARWPIMLDDKPAIRLAA